MPTAPENCRINYVELNVRDLDKAKAFYGQAFGWTFTDYGPQYTEFSDGAMKGGFTTQETPSPAGGALVILYADKLEAARDSVLAAYLAELAASTPLNGVLEVTDADGVTVRRSVVLRF